MNVYLIKSLLFFSFFSLLFSSFLPNSLKELFLNDTFMNIQERMKMGSMNGYLNYSEFENILEIIQKEYSDITKVEEIGSTFEKRKMFAIKIGKTENNSAILFTGMHHSREPVSFLMNINILFKILYDYTYNESSVIELIETRNILFIPVINIDGFVENIKNFDITGRYSKIRKNRRVSSFFDNCSIHDKGVDLNRNYDFKFGLDDEGNINFIQGSDSDYCKEAYRGEKPFSEPETLAVKAFIESNPKINIAFNYHSFGNLLIIPFNFDYANNTFLKNNYTYHYRLYQEFKQESGFPDNDIMGNGRESIGYPANGEASDWMLGSRGILAFSPELGINGDKKLYYKFYPNIDNAYDIIRANLFSSFYGIQKTGYFLKIQPIKKLYVDCISNTVFSHQKIPIDEKDRQNLKFCNDDLYEFSASLAIKNIGMGDLTNEFPIIIEVISGDINFFLLSLNDYQNGNSTNNFSYERNLTKERDITFNISTSLLRVESRKHLIMELKFYVTKSNFTKKDFLIKIFSKENNNQTISQYIFNKPSISLTKKDFDFFFINTPNSKKGTITESHDMMIIVYIFLGFIILLLIMFLFTLKKVRDFFNICPDEDLNAIGQNTIIVRENNNQVRFQRIQSDFEISTININNHSFNLNAIHTTESSEINSLT